MVIDQAKRLSDVQEYYFSSKLKEIADLRSQGRDIINLGIGSPDLEPPSKVIQTLKEAVDTKDAHGYQPYQGIPDLKHAITKFTKDQFGVDLNVAEALPLIGSKEGITHLSMAFLDPGDQVLIPDLGYPTYSSVTRMVGARPVYYPLREDQGWEPDWDVLESIDCSQVKLLWLNYPHMPTGVQPKADVLKRFIDFAHRKQLLLCHDNPYCFLGDENPVSILSLDGAKEVAVELHSMSKTFNMAGWRVGWLAGREDYLSAVLRIKSNVDSGMFRPIQLAAIEALRTDPEWYLQLMEVYRQRRDRGNEILSALNCTIEPDQIGMFIWAKIPGESAIDFSDNILADYDVFITPGHIFGEKGSKYLRLSLCTDQSVLAEVLNRIKSKK
ncbi:MAG: aminotransferase class I/II-fold pyridoxal phosphate-dependent enzyme [Cyclobacteriaceae bacterium]|nr:aminotransferase class I/II-fold pyridoxal phosphate-dependent enzyme [Cyclobacteriaceae bacterium HetDA_MAG_MS6]